MINVSTLDPTAASIRAPIEFSLAEEIIARFYRWLYIRRVNGRRDPFNMRCEMEHSSLLRRLLEGKEPFDEPPPRSYSYPWYELLENGWARPGEVRFRKDLGEDITDYHEAIRLAVAGLQLHIDQTCWEIIDRDESCWTIGYQITDTEAVCAYLKSNHPRLDLGFEHPNLLPKHGQYDSYVSLPQFYVAPQKPARRRYTLRPDGASWRLEILHDERWLGD